MHYVYNILCRDLSISTQYSGVTQDMELCEYFHRESSSVSDFINQSGGWDNWYFVVLSTHEFIKDARKLINPVPKLSTIYRIYSKDSHEQYIGQTDDFESRRVSHFLSCQMGVGGKLYSHIRLTDWKQWKMEIVKQYPYCENKFELCRLEWYWWNKLGGSLNSIKPGSHSFKWLGSDEDFEKSVDNGESRTSFKIKEISI